VSFLKRYKIGTKFIGVVTLILILSAVSLSIYQITLNNTIKGYAGILDRELDIERSARKASIAMLEARRSEKDFLMRMDLKYRSSVEEAVQIIKNEMSRTTDLAENYYSEVENSSGIILGLTVKYLDAFHNVVKGNELKGLTYEEGLQGLFRSAAGNLLNEVPKFSTDNLYIDLLQIRRYEKDYMRAKSTDYALKLISAIEQYDLDLETSRIEEEARNTQKKALGEYRSQVEAIMDGLPLREETRYYVLAQESARAMENAIKTVMVPNAETTTLLIRRHEKDYLLRGEEKYFRSAMETADKLEASFTASQLSVEDKKRIGQYIDSYRNAFAALVREDEIIAGYIQEMREATHAIEPKLTAIVELASKVVADKREQLRKEASFSTLIALIAAVSSLLLGLSLAVVTSLSITRPLKYAVRVIDEVSGGDFSIDIESDSLDETGIMLNSLKNMVQQISKIVNVVLTGASQIASASEQLATGNEDLSIRTEKQASALEETSAAIEEMNSSIRSNAENTASAADLSRDALSKASNGSKSVSRMVGSMNEISDSSNRISDIIEVINNIAFQTNLLALNASIEAARAGEQGKGFAVVAVEVRKLAKRSDKAASEIAGIIKSSNLKVNEGVSIAREAGEYLEEINNFVKKVTSIVSEISKASQEQLANVEQIDRSLSDLNEDTQKNAALVEESAASTEELSSQAQELNSNMQFFKLEKDERKLISAG